MRAEVLIDNDYVDIFLSEKSDKLIEKPYKMTKPTTDTLNGKAPKDTPNSNQDNSHLVGSEM